MISKKVNGYLYKAMWNRLFLPNADYIPTIINQFTIYEFIHTTRVCTRWNSELTPHLKKEKNLRLEVVRIMSWAFEKLHLITRLYGFRCIYCNREMGFTNEALGWASKQYYDTYYCSSCWDSLLSIDVVTPIKNNLSMSVTLFGQGKVMNLSTPSKYIYPFDPELLRLWMAEYLDRLSIFFPTLVNNLPIRNQYLTLISFGSILDWLPIQRYHIENINDNLFVVSTPIVYLLFCANPKNRQFTNTIYVVCNSIQSSFYTKYELLPGELVIEQTLPTPEIHDN